MGAYCVTYNAKFIKASDFDAKAPIVAHMAIHVPCRLWTLYSALMAHALIVRRTTLLSRGTRATSPDPPCTCHRSMHKGEPKGGTTSRKLLASSSSCTPADHTGACHTERPPPAGSSGHRTPCKRNPSQELVIQELVMMVSALVPSLVSAPVWALVVLLAQVLAPALALGGAMRRRALRTKPPHQGTRATSPDPSCTCHRSSHRDGPASRSPLGRSSWRRPADHACACHTRHLPPANWSGHRTPGKRGPSWDLVMVSLLLAPVWVPLSVPALALLWAPALAQL